MPQIDLSLMTITPLLMHGSNSKSPEVRATTFRGIFRYWTRALLGRASGNQLEHLSESESAIWGSTQQASAITVRVKAIESHRLVENQQLRVVPERTAFTGYKPDGRFELVISTHPLATEFPAIGLAGILLALRLGGFGTRSRRGGGDLLVLKAAAGDESDYTTEVAKLLQRNARDLDRLAALLVDDIEQALATVPYGASLGTGLPKYPIFLTEHTKVLLGETSYGSYQEALAPMWSLRSRADFHDENIFGLPNVKRRVFERRASPVHMHVGCTRVHVGRTREAYHPIMTIFRSEPERDWSIMQKFVDTAARNGFVQIFGDGVRWD